MEHLLRDESKTAEYNSVPVKYCKNCLSLRIMSFDGMDYCDHCGDTDIEENTIEEWEKLYIAKYGDKFLNK